MQLYQALCRSYSVIKGGFRACLHFRVFRCPFITPITKFVTPTPKSLSLFLSITLTSSVYSQDSIQIIPKANAAASLEVTLLTEARVISHNNKEKSTSLATEALFLSKNKKNHKIAAQAHVLLAELALESKDTIEAQAHFLQASQVYKSIYDVENQISTSLDYASTLLDQKNYSKASNFINELSLIAQQHNKPFYIALTLIAKGNIFYQNKLYDDAISQYTKALPFLTDSKHKTQKERGETYTKLAESYKRLKNREKTALSYKNALDIYTTIQEKKSMARTLNTLAEAERYLGNYVTALDYSVRGLQIHKEIDDPIGQTKALMGAGIIYRYIGSYEKSLEHVHQAQMYYKKVNNYSGIAKTANEIGHIYKRTNELAQARSYYQITINQPEKVLEPKTLATALREIAVVDYNSKKYESSMQMAQKAHQIYSETNDYEKGSTTARIIGYIHLDTNQISQAITYFRESLSLARKIGHKINQIKAQTALASALIGENTNEAIELLKNSATLASTINDKPEMLYAYRLLRRAKKSAGNFYKALYFAEKEIELLEIIQKDNEENGLILEKAKLHSHQIELDLESLKEKAEQERKIAELKLAKNQYASIALASILAICIPIMIFVYRQFIGSKKRNKELGYLASRDPLTNCYNRRALFDILNQDFSEVELLVEYCVVLVDIDKFKDINDSYGHNTGDTVLRAIADILQSSVRQNDIVSRFGGEEFCIVLPNTTKEQAIRIAEDMRIKIEKYRFNCINVTCSFGIASIEFNAHDPIDLIEQADLALYQSKKSGRNKVTLWNKLL